MPWSCVGVHWGCVTLRVLHFRQRLAVGRRGDAHGVPAGAASAGPAQPASAGRMAAPRIPFGPSGHRPVAPIFPITRPSGALDTHCLRKKSSQADD